MTEKRVAIVTGSSSGIGAAVATRLAAEGVRVVVNSARSVEAGTALAASLPEATYVRADIADQAEAEALVAAAVEAYGRLDILVNNAGTTRLIPHGDLDAATPEVWREILAVNVVGTWQTSVAALPHLREGGAADTEQLEQRGVVLRPARQPATLEAGWARMQEGQIRGSAFGTARTTTCPST